MSNLALLSTRAVAARLDVDARTVHRMVKRGDIAPAFTTPGYRGDLLFDPAAVDALAEERAK